VKTGSTDGTNTVITEGDLKPGTDLIIEMIEAK